MAQEITKEEAVNRLLHTLASMARAWGTAPKQTQYSACQGMAFSFLSMLDGSSGGIPAFNLHPSPHPDDKQYWQDNGENWWGTDSINDEVSLHELWHRFERSNPSPTPRDGYNQIVTGAEMSGWEATQGLSSPSLKKTMYKEAFLKHIGDNFDSLYPDL